MPRWVCIYPRPRNIGLPFGVVTPGQVVEHPVCPYPDCFLRVAEDAAEEPKRRGRPAKETTTAEPVAAQQRAKGITSDIFTPKPKAEEPEGDADGDTEAV